MPVNSRGKHHSAREGAWKRLQKVYAGEDEIKAAGEEYLPQLSGQSTDEYNAYKARGVFFNAHARTVQGLTGAALRKPPKVSTKKAILETFQTDMTLSGMTFEELARKCTEEVLNMGYFGVMVDMPVSNGTRPYCALYEALDILSARTQRIDGEEKLTYLVVHELVDIPDTADRFNTKEIEQCREMTLEEDGFLIVRLWRKGDSGEWGQVEIEDGLDEAHPAVRGSRLDFIPFVFFGAMENSAMPGKPPLLDLANLNIKHWQLSVDYYHGLHFCALPTPWAAGFEKDATLYIGCTKAWISEAPEARCGYLEFSGQGLAAIEKAIEKLEHKMAVMGARMLEEQKRASEAAETLKLRSSGDTATLSNIASNVGKGLERVLEIMLKWSGVVVEVEVEMNRDFVSQRLDSKDVTALLQAWNSSAISLDTFLHNLAMGEILPEDRTIDDEKDLIEAEGKDEFENAPPPYQIPTNTPATPGLQLVQ